MGGNWDEAKHEKRQRDSRSFPLRFASTTIGRRGEADDLRLESSMEGEERER